MTLKELCEKEDIEYIDYNKDDEETLGGKRF